MNNFQQRDEAVSSVLGAIMMVPILISTLLVVQLEFVPVWDEDREAAHADAVANQIGFIKSEMDRMSVAGTTAPVTAHVDLRTETSGFRVFGSGARTGGTATYAPYESDMQMRSASLTVQTTGGTSLLGVDETWEAVQDGVEIGPIDELLHLRVRVPNPHDLSAGITSTLTLLDANGDYAGRLQLRNGQDAVYVSTYGAKSQTTPLTNRLDDTDPDGPTFYFNLLDSNLLFDSVVAAASKPVSIVLDEGGLPADFTVVYDWETPTGRERIGADAGVRYESYNFTAPAGTLSIHVPSQEFVDQTYVFEHGAVILDQGNGAVMSAPPSFKATRGAVQDRIQWNIPTAIGNPGAVSSAQATVTMTPAAGGLSVSGLAPDLSVRLPTAYPAVWADYWNRELGDAGYEASEYAIQLTADSATLQILGPVPDPGSTTNDVVLDIELAPIQVRLTPFS